MQEKILQILRERGDHDYVRYLEGYFAHHENKPSLSMVQYLVELSGKCVLDFDKAQAAVNDLYDWYMAGRKLDA